jgi:hypothetical protein
MGQDLLLPAPALRLLLPFGVAFAAFASHAANEIVVGSKRFTESYILGEIARRRWWMPACPPRTARGWATPR